MTAAPDSLVRLPTPFPDSDHVEALTELLRLHEHIHRQEISKLTATVMAYRQLVEEQGWPPLDDEAGELALIQFHRFRSALERLYLWFNENGGVPQELHSWFLGTILT